MSLACALTESFERSFRLYDDFALSLSSEDLSSKNPGVRSNTIGLQLWCVVGARESYSAAIKNDGSIEFSCSLKSTTECPAVLEALSDSSKTVIEALEFRETFSDNQNRLALDLLEHETAHQGQLIRYLYALNMVIPASWKSRYSLS